MAKDSTDAVHYEDVQAVRPSTDTNLILQLVAGTLGTLAIAFATLPLRDSNLARFYGIINERGPVQYFTLFMTFMVGMMIFLKYKTIRRQLRVIADDPVDTGINLDDDDQVSELRKKAVEMDESSWSIVLSRMDRLLSLWLSTKDIARVATWASSESERDQNASDSSYSLSRVLVWAIPILGFIGTVMGLGDAVSGFSTFLAGAADLTQIKGAISDVTVGLGVAFDTTLLALVLSVIIMFPLSSVQRSEENLFVEIDNYLEDTIISRLPSPDQQPIVVENMEDSIEAAFRRYIPDPDRYEEVFSRSIDRASGVVEERFGTLAGSYESTLNDLTAQLSASMATVGDSMEASMAKMVQDLHKQEQAILDARKGISDHEAERFKSLVGEIHESSRGVAEEYHKSADALRKASEEGLLKTHQATRDLGDRLADVSKMAEGIQDLLKIEKTLGKSLDAISASAEFQQTLQDLRAHLQSTSEFCNRISRPRVITLREEVK